MFPDHPYQVKDDECMNDLVSSIKERGLIQPIIVRPIEDNLYEMVSGHRRKRAFELAGLKSIPAKVMELSRDEAILVMVDSNLQREVILPSEKAKAYAHGFDDYSVLEMDCFDKASIDTADVTDADYVVYSSDEIEELLLKTEE